MYDLSKLTDISTYCHDNGYDYEIASRTYMRDGTPWYVTNLYSEAQH